MEKIKKIKTLLVNTVIFIFLYMVIQIPSVSEIYIGHETNHNFNWLLHFSLMIVGCAFALYLVLNCYKKINAGSKKLKNYKKLFFQNVIIAGIIYLIEILIAMTTGYDANQTEYLIGMLKTSQLAVFIIFENIIIAPILEEILFRGILQSNFFQKINPIINIFLTAFIFAFLHSGQIDWVTAENFVLGVGLGVSCFYSNSLVQPIVIHMVNNLLVILIGLF
jgi:uncharacterized protein